MIPKLMHFFWIGTDLPEKYLHNILSFSSFCKKEQINIFLWTDSTSLKSILKNDIRLPKNIEIKDINQLIEYGNLCLDGAYKELTLFIARESIGLANYAAATDILRVFALHLYGGYHCDPDNIAIDHIVCPQPKHGFAVANFDCEIVNSFIASEPNHEILNFILDFMLEKLKWLLTESDAQVLYFYESSSSHELEKNCDAFNIDSLYQRKRKPNAMAKKELTLDTTGPSAYIYGITRYIEKNSFNGQSLTEYTDSEQFEDPFDILERAEEAMARIHEFFITATQYQDAYFQNLKFFQHNSETNLVILDSIQLECDLNWLKPLEKGKKSFEEPNNFKYKF